MKSGVAAVHRDSKLSVYIRIRLLTFSLLPHFRYLPTMNGAAAYSNGSSLGSSSSNGSASGSEQVVFVTGSSSGNGRGIALAFAAQGATVICADLGPSHPVRTCRTGRRRLLTDNSRATEWRDAYRSAHQEFGRSHYVCQARCDFRRAVASSSTRDYGSLRSYRYVRSVPSLQGFKQC